MIPLLVFYMYTNFKMRVDIGEWFIINFIEGMGI